MFAGRKFLGPLDVAQINSYKFCTNMLRGEILYKLIQEIEDVEKMLIDEEIPEAEKILANILKNELDSQLKDFLGIENDGSKSKIHTVSDQKI